MLDHHLVDLRRTYQAEGARFVVTGLRAWPLRRVDGEEAAVDTAVDHARQVDLTAVLLDRMAVGDVPARPGEQRRGVHVGIQNDGGIMHRARLRRHLYAAHGLGERDVGEQHRRGAKQDFPFHSDLKFCLSAVMNNMNPGYEAKRRASHSSLRHSPRLAAETVGFRRAPIA